MPACEKTETFRTTVKILKSMTVVQTLLDKSDVRPCRLLLVVPATSATAEFLSLASPKAYSRATMQQARLNSLLVLHYHRDRAGKLNMKPVFQEFICVSDKHSNFFGIGLSCIQNFLAS